MAGWHWTLAGRALRRRHLGRFSLPALLGLAHGAADGASGLLLGSLAGAMPLQRVAVLVLLYNVLAFGAQPLVGLAVDRLRRPRAAALGGLLAIAAALVLSGWQPEAAVALAGLGSAAFHVGGGALALFATPARAAGPGIFAAPGVVGLAVGGALVVTGHAVAWPFVAALLALFLLVAWHRLPEQQPYAASREEPMFEAHDLIMIALIAGIALRSAVWTTIQYLLEGQTHVLVAVAVAAAIGKLAGGFLADRLGWRRWAIGSLAVAAPLLILGGHHLATLLPGVALLQSATSVTLAAAWRVLPRQPATAAGLALGLAIAIGGIPPTFGFSPQMGAPPAVALCAAAAGLLLWWSLGGIRWRSRESGSPT